jgi:hypothetical protein
MLAVSKAFTHFPEGGHDNGYTSTLNYLQNEGLLDKVTLLRGYEVLAKELRNLNLPHLEIEGVFMAKKLQSKRWSKLVLPPAFVPSLQPEDFEIFKMPSTSVPRRSTSTRQSLLLVPTQVSYLSVTFRRSVQLICSSAFG